MILNETFIYTHGSDVPSDTMVFGSKLIDQLKMAEHRL